MERDASALEVLPPIEWALTRKVLLAGTALCGTAALLGLASAAIDDPPAILTALRLILVFIGALATGIAVSFRPDRPAAWLIGAGASVLAMIGTPHSWDSFQLLFGVLAGLALLRAAMSGMSAAGRRVLVSVFILLHFFGILLATTSPQPVPWMVEQIYRRVYEPYLHFVYLRNAYHFYSPEPGPASVMACLLKTEDGEEVSADGVRRKKYRTEWQVMPRRPQDIRDPMGVTYYRRLSLTEQIAHSYPDMMSSETFEKSEIRGRRLQLAQAGANPYIPLHPRDSIYLQYRLPEQIVSRYLLPSYAQHILMDLPEKDRARTTVKIYRIEHRTLQVGAYIGVLNPDKKPGDPYHPTTYYPYFQGEFGFAKNPADGKIGVQLLDPQEPMLYWLVPIIERPGNAKKNYDDYLSVHAGLEFDWSQLR
jgi:hypothetical protein